ncbi:MAG: ATP-dependent helicase [Eubacteriales bacterium]
MINFFDELNDKQKEAASHKEGPLLILAGAGSGKTSTMTKRIAHLIENEQISAYNILAVTFTNKAAREMRERIEALIGTHSQLWVLTFHSTCLRILRIHAEALGYTKNFVIYDPTDQKTVMKACIKKVNLDDKTFTPNYLLSIVSKNKENQISVSDYRKNYATDFKTQKIADIYETYNDELMKNDAMDFDDLIANTVKLFEENPNILAQYRERFKYIMVDEYQDTNYLQYKLIRLLSEPDNNICVVGDDDQCIYQWRGADIRNILDFEKDFKDTKVIKLEQNYRSKANILEAAHSVVVHNLQRKDKKLWTNQERGEKITRCRTGSERDEANYIAKKIERFADEGRSYNEIAVLYRQNAQSRIFEDVFMARNIPYRVLGGMRYYDRKEIKDILSYMRLLVNLDDEVAFLRVINEPKRGIGEKSLDKLREVAEENGINLIEALATQEGIECLTVKSQDGGTEFVNMIKKYRNFNDYKVQEIYEGILEESGYIKMLQDAKTMEATSRIENLMEFKTVIMEYEQLNPDMNLEEFMAQLALLSDVDNHNADEDAVVLMTLHSAKGLEFPIVFMPGLEDEVFPSRQSMAQNSKLEEERRLCYVGITRAKEKLFLTSAEKRTIYGKTNRTVESCFIREINKNLLENDADYLKEQQALYEQNAKFSVVFKNASRKKKTIIGNSWKMAGDDGFSQENVDLPFSVNDEDEIASFDIGMRVSHAKFGEGLIMDMNDKIMSVMFEKEGLKKLGKINAPLEIIG